MTLFGPDRTGPLPFSMPDDLPAHLVFNASPESAERIGRLRSAIGIQAALRAVQGYAAGELLRHAARPDGMIDQARLTAWRDAHAEALRAVPELAVRIADPAGAVEAIAEVAFARKAAVEERQREDLANLIQLPREADVAPFVAFAVQAPDAAVRMTAIRREIGKDMDALKGFKRAIVEAMIRDGAFVMVSADVLREAGFAPGELRALDIIAAAVRLDGSTLRVAAELLDGPASDPSPFLVAMRCAGLRTRADLVADTLASAEPARLHLVPGKDRDGAATLDTLARSFARSAVQALADGVAGRTAGVLEPRPIRRPAARPARTAHSLKDAWAGRGRATS